MSNLKQKSEFNLDAAEKLLKQTLYAPSVHCSYYSCFQLMKFTIKDFFKVSYEKQKIDTSYNTGGSHTYVIKYISSELKKIDRRDGKDFQRKIKDLQQLRLESDYDDIQIDSSKGYLAHRKANEVRLLIMEKFKV